MLKKLFNHKNKIILLQLATTQIVINFITSFLIVKKIGFSSELDIYFIALAVFNFLTTSIGWSISSVMTPMLIEHRESKIEGQMFINIIIITLPIFLILLLTMFFWTKLIFINYINIIDFDKIILIQSGFLITFLFANINIIFYSILQERNEYIKLNLFYMISAIVGLLFVYYTIDSLGIYAAVSSQVVIQLFLFISMFIITFKSFYKNIKFNKATLFLLWNRMKYVFFGSLYYRSDELIEKYIASFLTPGFLSLASFIQRVYSAIITVLNTSITAPTITKFSNLIKEKNYKKIQKIFYEYFLLLFVLDLIAFIIILLFGEKLFLLFFSDNIEESFLPILLITLLFLFSVVFGKTLGMIQRTLFLSAKKEKLVTQLNVSIFTFSIFIKILSTYYFGIYGFLSSILINEIIVLIVQQIYIQRILRNENFS